MPTSANHHGGHLADNVVHFARALRRAGVAPDQLDETLFGHGRQAGQGPSTGRQVAVRAGVPVESPAWTVNMACGSGLKSVMIFLSLSANAAS